MENTSFVRSSFTLANLQKADLRNALFEECDLWGTDFTESSLDDAKFIRVYTHNVILKECTAEKIEIQNSFFKKADFSRSWIIQPSFICSYFDDANFDNSIITDSTIKRSSFNSASVKDTYLGGSQICYSSFIDSCLVKAGFPYFFTASAMEISPSGVRRVISSSFHVPSPIFSP